MTIRDWFAATDPDPLLDAGSELRHVRDHGRRRRLFGCACARQVWHLLSTDARSAVFTSERLAEGTAKRSDLRAATLRLPGSEIEASQMALSAAGWALGATSQSGHARRLNPNEELTYEPRNAARLAARAVATELVGRPPPGHSPRTDAWHVAWTQAYDGARATQADYVRDLFPPPRYTPRCDPQWLTSTVVALARQMNELGDFSAVPILADALQDAGCEDEMALRCCRTPGNAHVRGNWVVDLVLDKL